MRWVLAFLVCVALPVHAQKTEKATFAAGCFWCTEEAFEKVPGVISAVSGYTGGTVKGLAIRLTPTATVNVRGYMEVEAVG